MERYRRTRSPNTVDGSTQPGSEAMNARRIQIVAMVVSALFIPLFMAGSRLIWSSPVLSAAFLLALYVSVVAALFSTVVLYQSERHSLLARWRRTSYVTGVVILLAMCLLPLATWPIALSVVTPHFRSAVLCLLGVNAAAAILVWFGRGWSRLGLTVVAYWICFLWIFPLGLRQ